MNGHFVDAAVRAEVASRRRSGKRLFLGLLFSIVAGYFLFYPVVVMKVMCFALFAVAYNLLLGHVGLMSLGHAAFFGGAAYVSAHVAKDLGGTPEVALLAGTGFACLLGIAIGALAIRRRGIGFAMISLALAQMFFFFCAQVPFTRGEDGIQGVPRGRLLGVLDLDSNGAMYVLVSAVFLGGMAAIWRIVHSPFGAVLSAIRQSEPRAISLGYSVERYKLAAFVVSATLSGLAGATKALVFQLATLTDVAWTMSGDVVLMVLLGGIGMFLGPVVGAASIVGLQELLSALEIPVPLVMGAIFILCINLFPSGITSSFGLLLRRWRPTA